MYSEAPPKPKSVKVISLSDVKKQINENGSYTLETTNQQGQDIKIVIEFSIYSKLEEIDENGFAYRVFSEGYDNLLKNITELKEYLNEEYDIDYLEFIE